MNAATEQDLPEDCAWAVWTLEVRDPDSATPPGIGERTSEPVTEMCAALGCVFDLCADDDSVDDVPYYRWTVRVPIAEHRGRGNGRPPAAVQQIWDYLRTRLPDGLDDWTVQFDEDETLDLYLAAAVREDYSDLITPIEVALLGLRRDGTERHEPIIRRWASSEAGFAYTYTMTLGFENPQAAHTPWLYLTVGAALSPAFWSSPLGQGLQRYGHRPGTPILTLQRPAVPQVWMVSMTTSGFAPDGHAQRAQHFTGARHEWTGADPLELSKQVAADITALFPRLGRKAAGS